VRGQYKYKSHDHRRRIENNNNNNNNKNEDEDDGNDNDVELSVSKIIGGSDVRDPNRFPYFALMNGNGLCGAVLISPRFVLSAAHCVGSDDDFEIGISEQPPPQHGFSFFEDWFHDLLGDASDSESESDRGGTEYAYKRNGVAVHPEYNSNTLDNDIALFELEEDVVEKNLSYIRLRQEPISVPGTQMAVIGFGTTIDSELFGSAFVSDTLKQTTVDYVSETDCNQRFVDDNNSNSNNRRGPVVVSPNMLCAFEEDTDSCQGDSGGPLLLPGNNGPEGDSLVGLVSWGFGCGKSTPGVYTRISYFYDWIVETMCARNPRGVPDYVDCGNTGSSIGSGSGSGSGGDADADAEPPTLSPTSSSSNDAILGPNNDGGDDDWFNFDDDSTTSSSIGSFLSDAWDTVTGWVKSLF